MRRAQAAWRRAAPLAAALLLLLAAAVLPAGAQQQQQPSSGAPAGGDPAVQSTAPEVGSGRGGVNNQPPPTTEPTTPTGGPRPAEPQSTAPRPPTPTQEVVAPPVLTDRNQPDAAELELQRALRGGVIEGRVSIPNQSAGILIQPDGRDWRQFRNGPLLWTGVVLLLGAIGAIVVFHLVRGRAEIEGGRSGRTVQRFDALERANHWMVAASFIVLGLSGLNITYGREVLRPVIGAEAFTTVTLLGQAAHQYLSFPFTLGIVVMLALWVRQNLPSREDIAYIRAGGPLGSSHPPAGKFNAAQKALFWFVVLAGAGVAVSGYLLMFPMAVTDVIGQQWAHMAHGLLALVMIATIIGHIYIGSLGMEGAFEAMGSGRVDYNWAKQHHSLWLEEELSRARGTVAPSDRQARPAGAD